MLIRQLVLGLAAFFMPGKEQYLGAFTNFSNNLCEWSVVRTDRFYEKRTLVNMYACVLRSQHCKKCIKLSIDICWLLIDNYIDFD